uniref:Glutaminyl-peptide cyclotransferase-like n=1 Tax=Rhizophora mucronata TaxID=61149 RepID=A0A2P2LB50_RHIMU
MLCHLKHQSAVIHMHKKKKSIGRIILTFSPTKHESGRDYVCKYSMSFLYYLAHHVIIVEKQNAYFANRMLTLFPAANNSFLKFCSRTHPSILPSCFEILAMQSVCQTLAQTSSFINSSSLR